MKAFRRRIRGKKKPAQRERQRSGLRSTTLARALCTQHTCACSDFTRINSGHKAAADREAVAQRDNNDQRSSCHLAPGTTGPDVLIVNLPSPPILPASVVTGGLNLPNMRLCSSRWQPMHGRIRTRDPTLNHSAKPTDPSRTLSHDPAPRSQIDPRASEPSGRHIGAAATGLWSRSGRSDAHAPTPGSQPAPRCD
jgi:hypothetical protein